MRAASDPLRRRWTRLVPAACLLAGLASACTEKSGKGPLTPEQAAGAADGARVVVEGDVHTLTFDSVLRARPSGGEEAVPLADRFVLLRSAVPPGVSIHDPTRASVDVAWGLGVRVPAAVLATSRLPQIGDRLRVTGTLRRVTWNEHTLPVVEDAVIEVLGGAPPLALAGEGCARDLDCQERLICDRATRACVAPPELTWGSDLRNIHGTCTSDADCPLDQRCETGHVVPASGPYAPPYYLSRDAGKSLCVAEDGATAESLCPRRARTLDLVGGRFAPGREVCVEGDVWLLSHADDGDTHLQLVVPEPLPYPAADVPYFLFGATTENVPPYKDPSRPQGALTDPQQDDHIVVIGTVRWDDSHAWWEVHPIKALFHVPAPPGASRRYPSRPAGFDFDSIEKENDGR